MNAVKSIALGNRSENFVSRTIVTSAAPLIKSAGTVTETGANLFLTSSRAVYTTGDIGETGSYTIDIQSGGAIFYPERYSVINTGNTGATGVNCRIGGDGNATLYLSGLPGEPLDILPFSYVTDSFELSTTKLGSISTLDFEVDILNGVVRVSVEGILVER